MELEVVRGCVDTSFLFLHPTESELVAISNGIYEQYGWATAGLPFFIDDCIQLL